MLKNYYRIQVFINTLRNLSKILKNANFVKRKRGGDTNFVKNHKKVQISSEDREKHKQKCEFLQTAAEKMHSC